MGLELLRLWEPLLCLQDGADPAIRSWCAQILLRPGREEELFSGKPEGLP